MGTASVERRAEASAAGSTRISLSVGVTGAATRRSQRASGRGMSRDPAAKSGVPGAVARPGRRADGAARAVWPGARAPGGSAPSAGARRSPFPGAGGGPRTARPSAGLAEQPVDPARKLALALHHLALALHHLALARLQLPLPQAHFAPQILDALRLVAHSRAEAPDLPRSSGDRNVGLHGRDGGVSARRGPRNRFEPREELAITDLPGVLPRDLPAAGREAGLRALPHRPFESRHELLGGLVQIDHLRERLELRQAPRDNGLSGGQVLVELDGIGRLGQRRALKRNRADVEPRDVRGKVRVGHLAEPMNVGPAFQGLERGSARVSDQGEGPFGMATRGVRDRGGVEPAGDRSVVADDRPGECREGTRAARGKRRESLQVGGIGQVQGVGADPPDALQKHARGRDDEVAFGQKPLLVAGRLGPVRPEARVLVEAVVDEPPAVAVPEPTRQRLPGRVLDEEDHVRKLPGRCERLDRSLRLGERLPCGGTRRTGRNRARPAGRLRTRSRPAAGLPARGRSRGIPSSGRRPGARPRRSTTGAAAGAGNGIPTR